MQKKSILAQGQNVAYRTYGKQSANPIVLLHGFCEDSLLWNPILPMLKGKRVVAIDLPGFGGSDSVPNTRMGSYSSAVKHVLDAEAITGCTLLGHSMGGYTALDFLEKYPNRIQGLGLIHAHPFEDSPEKKNIRRRSIKLIELGKKDMYLNMLFPDFFEQNFIQKHPNILRLLKRRALKFPKEGIIGALEAMMHRTAHTRTLEQCTCPVYYFLGGKDSLLPPIETNTMLQMPAVLDFHFLSEVGHMGMFEAPEVLAQSILEFHTFVLQRN